MVYLNEDFCVICGCPIPEGRMVCPCCGKKVLNDPETYNGNKDETED